MRHFDGPCGGSRPGRVGRGHRRIAQRPGREQSTLIQAHIRTRCSVYCRRRNAHVSMCTRRFDARERRTSRREGGEGPRCLEGPAQPLGWPASHAHTCIRFGQATYFSKFDSNFACARSARKFLRNLPVHTKFACTSVSMAHLMLLPTRPPATSTLPGANVRSTRTCWTNTKIS